MRFVRGLVQEFSVINELIPVARRMNVDFDDTRVGRELQGG